MKSFEFHTWSVLSVLAIFLAGGCAKNEAPAGNEGYGTLRIACSTDPTVSTRAEIETGPVPATGDFSLTISGSDYLQEWESIPAFNASETTFTAGSYTVEIEAGDPTTEGVDKPYYFGTKNIEIVARKSVEETIQARIANSQVFVNTTESFRKYFHDATFTVMTSAGNRFTFTPGAESSDVAVFVEAGTKLTLTGEAKLQSQTGTDFDRAYTFPEQTLEQTVARTRHTFLFDARDNGSATVTINLYDEYLDERTITVELNDNSQLDSNA